MERVSALMDGELGEKEAVEQLKRIRQDPELRTAWETYHVIGDALRGQAELSPGFVARVAARLEQEPAVLAPRRRLDNPFVMKVALPIAASVCGVAVVAWLALGNPFQTLAPNAGEMQLATTRAPETSLQAVPAAVAVNDYLFAHQQFSPRTALQGVAPYVHTVPSEGADSN
jgi:sigma-E factor negative regulatory protein RseA